MAVEDVWRRLGCPKYVVAPMVDASELAWRMLCRQHGAQLCYTPMLHSQVFLRDERYRRELFTTCMEDRPLIVQFCANDPDTLLKAAKLVESSCDGIDINLGCPQTIARRGHYGAFLQDEWDLLTKMVRTLRENISIPVSCKIRIFDDVERSKAYAKMLEEAGCQMLTVHGRTREQKGPLTGTADWTHIKEVKTAIKIPLLANGNIQCLNDVERCICEIGCNGVMSAEGILHNPALFEGILYPVWELTEEYLRFVEQYPCPISYVRGHVFKIMHHVLLLSENNDIRDVIARGRDIRCFIEMTSQLKERYIKIHNGEAVWDYLRTDYDMTLPPWICQPWVRMAPEDHIKKMTVAAQMQKHESNYHVDDDIAGKRPLNDTTNGTLSKKKLKRSLRNPHIRNPKCRQRITLCELCPNPAGLKCDRNLCKTCCRVKCKEEDKGCGGHRIKWKGSKNVRIVFESDTLNNHDTELVQMG